MAHLFRRRRREIRHPPHREIHHQRHLRPLPTALPAGRRAYNRVGKYKRNPYLFLIGCINGKCYNRLPLFIVIVGNIIWLDNDVKVFIIIW